MPYLLTLLHTNPQITILLMGFIGLLVGSFLNVVIYRLPIIMHKQWRVEATNFIKAESDLASIIGLKRLTQMQNSLATDKPLTLSTPASHCPNCQQKIRWYHNIPLIGWLILGGKCSHCKQSISLFYPLVECVTALLSALMIYKLGFTPSAIAGLLLLWGLIALAVIDWQTQLLPDRITYPLAMCGLLVNSQQLFVSPSNAIWGLVIGFLCLWSVNFIFYLVTKKQGMGQGDFKLLAVLGAWLGVAALPLIVLMSSVLGVLVGMGLLVKSGKSQPFAFGPYIAIAGIVVMLYGHQIMTWYINVL